MIAFLALALILIFISISILHFYWALGGKKWINFAIPTKATATPLFKPTFIETLVVAIGFLFFVWIIGMNAKLFPFVWLTQNYVTYTTFGIAAIFLLRAVGEFKYVGFFKKVKETAFGQMDSRYYSPLCLLIAIITLIINL